jgi:benzoyl-CoA reductase/2-hydroxyglutaryl-CoA dehydratase subunit BcrC/BadD/HgdB
MKTIIKPLAATALSKRLLADHFSELDRAAKSKERPIAWCSSVGPAELLRALGFLVYFPENHAAMIGASRLAGELMPRAHALGYSPDICSYLTSDIGAYLSHTSPLAKAYPGIDGFFTPTVLVYNTNQCRDVKEWFTFYGRAFKAPVLGLSSFHSVGEVTADQVAAMTAQYRALAGQLAALAGAPLDIDRLREVMALSALCSRLWGRALATAAARPSPWTFFDGSIHMSHAVIGRGTQAAVDYYTALNKELDERVENGQAAVEGERHRFYWEGMPIWGRLRLLAEQFARLGTCVAASTYCNSWVFDGFDPRQPFESMARAYLELFIVRDEEYKERHIAQMAAKYGIDGILFHDAKTCPNNSNCRYGMPDRLRRTLGIPTLVIQGDLNDPHLYADEQSATRIEAFIETIGGDHDPH